MTEALLADPAADPERVKSAQRIVRYSGVRKSLVDHRKALCDAVRKRRHESCCTQPHRGEKVLLGPKVPASLKAILRGAC